MNVFTNILFLVKYIPDIDLGPDTVLCKEESLALKPQHPVNLFLWNDGTEDGIKTIMAPGNYWVEVPSECLVRDTISVTYIDCPGKIPNVITPNNDLFNKNFAIENIEKRQWALQVFNRWGDEVYCTEKYVNDWNANGLSDGIYFYTLFSPDLDKTLKGWVHVLR